MECIESRFQITTPTDIKICRGFLFVYCISNLVQTDRRDAGPYIEKSNFLIRGSIFGLFLSLYAFDFSLNRIVKVLIFILRKGFDQAFEKLK